MLFWTREGGGGGGLSDSSAGKDSACNAGDPGSIPGVKKIR